MRQLDKYWIGITLGLLLPAIFGCVYLDHYDLWKSLSLFEVDYIAPLLSKLLLVSVFPNLALIFVFYTTNTWNLSKGVLIGAFPYMIAAVIFSSL